MTAPIAPTDTPVLLARASMLHADLVVLCAESRELLQRGRDRRFSSTYSRLRPIRGASDSSVDVGLVTEAIAGAFLCVQCIARKTGLPPVEVDGALKTIARTLRLGIGSRRCDGCFSVKPAFSVITNTGDARQSASPKPPAIGQLVFPFDLQPGDVVIDGDARLKILGRPMSLSNGRMTHVTVRREDDTVERDAVWQTWRKVRVVRPSAA